MKIASKLIAMTFGWNGVGFAISLINGILTARLLLPSDRGVFAIAVAATAVMATISALGTNVSFRVHFPRGTVTARQYFRVGSLLVPLNLLLVISFCLLYGQHFEPMLSTGVLIVLVSWLGISSFASLQLYDFFNASGKTATSAFLSTVGSVFVMLLLFLAAMVSPNIQGVILGYSLGYSLRVILAVGLIVYQKKQGESTMPGSEGKAPRSRHLFTSGYRLLGLNLGQSLTYQSDRFFLGGVVGSSAVGQYAVAATPVSVPRVLSESIGQVLFRRTATGEAKSREIWFYTFCAILQTGGIAFVLSLVAPWLIPFLFGEQYSDAVPILMVLLVAEVTLAPYLVLSRVAAGLGMVNVAGTSGVLGLVLMLVSLSIFVPIFGVWGAAYSKVGVFAIMSLFVTIMVYRYLRKTVKVEVSSG